MSISPSRPGLHLACGLAALTACAALAAPTLAQTWGGDAYGQGYSRSYSQNSYSQSRYSQGYARSEGRVVIAYDAPSPYDYGYSYGRSGVSGPVYEGETRVYAATGAAATGRSGYGYDDRYGYDHGGRGEVWYQPPRQHDRYAWRDRQRHDGYGDRYDRGYDRGGRYGYSVYQGYRDEYGYQDDRPRSARHRGYERRDDRYHRRRHDCGCADVYLYDR